MNTLPANRTPTVQAPNPFSRSRFLGFLLLRSALLGAVIFLAACTTSPTGRSQLMLVSPQSAIGASKQAYANEVRKYRIRGKLLLDRQLAAEVQQITGHLVAEAVRQYPHTANWPWSVALFDDPEPNAWCMAGGRMGVFSGLFSKLRLNRDEFAHIMGHEIAHALANHSAESMSVALGNQLGISILTELIGGGQRTSESLTQAAQLAIGLPNSRTAESEADRIGSDLTVRAGYEPWAAVTLWEKMAAEGGSPPEFLSTHPDPGNRVARLKAMMPQLERVRQHGFGNPWLVHMVGF